MLERIKGPTYAFHSIPQLLDDPMDIDVPGFCFETNPTTWEYAISLALLAEEVLGLGETPEDFILADAEKGKEWMVQVSNGNGGDTRHYTFTEIFN